MTKNFNEKINLDELYKKRKYTNEKKIETYKKILNRVHTKIKYISRQKPEDMFCFYTVPEVILGIPRYNTTDCTTFLIEKLIENGFIVKYTHPNLLFISWKHYIPHHERIEYKKKTGTTIDGFGNVLKQKNIKRPEDTNDLMFNTKVPLQNKKINDNYKQINTYKPTGNFIYSNELVKTIEEKITK